MPETGIDSSDNGDGQLNQILDLIPLYPEYIKHILTDTFEKDLTIDPERRISVGKRVLDSFFGMFMTGAISPRRIEYILKHGIVTHSDFQELIVEIGVHNILTGTPEYLLAHFVQNPEIIQDVNRIIKNPLVQSRLKERIAFLKENKQTTVVMLLEQFLSN